MSEFVIIGWLVLGLIGWLVQVNRNGELYLLDIAVFPMVIFSGPLCLIFIVTDMRLGGLDKLIWRKKK